IKLRKLGESRGSQSEQRLYLLRISQRFQSLVESGVDGTYNDIFFGDAKTPKGRDKRIRAVIQNLNIEFSKSMQLQGHYHEIEDEIEDVPPYPDNESSNNSIKQKFPITISRQRYIDEVQSLLKDTRGKELPGMPNPSIVGELFYRQSEPWELLAQGHVKSTLEAVVTFL